MEVYNMKNLQITFPVIVIVLLFSCTKSIEREAEKSNVETVLSNFIEAWETKNMPTISQIWSHDEDMINFGTDAAERWVGWEAMKEKYSQMFDSFEKIDFVISNQSVKISQSGVTAWYSENMDGSFIINGEEISVKDLRVTGVLEKRDGNWVIVQRHVSIPESGQAVEY